MADLPKKLTLSETQEKWASQLNPVLKNPIVGGIVLSNIVLTTGNNVISHKLGRKLQGWYLTRVNAAIMLYDTQDSNQMPERTLTLVASAPATVNIAVF